MKNFYLVNYSVGGIKCLDKDITISCYKKYASKVDDTKKFHVKGIYGMNGTGKTGIITSVKILKGLLTQSNYLFNPLLQEHLKKLVNKSSKSLHISAEFLVDLKDIKNMYLYDITLSEGDRGYYIAREKLSIRNPLSKTSEYSTIFQIAEGEIEYLCDGIDNGFENQLRDSVKNLLTTSAISSVFYEKINTYDITQTSFSKKIKEADRLFLALVLLNAFGNRISVYLDDYDKHVEYFWMDEISRNGNSPEALKKLIDNYSQIERCDSYEYLFPGTTHVHKSNFKEYKESVEQLEKFLKRFKNDLLAIDIDKKVNHDIYVCNLDLKYKDGRVNTEFESTGIKKLIKLYMYFKRMVNGDIVFIDEFDSNLHDVYLCALLEYMMEYGEGQLIFTTHNVGPMNILQRNKKSIDFISVNHKVYSWVNNGNYSAAKLYREGMIEGSPFNIEAIDFIGLFEEEAKR